MVIEAALIERIGEPGKKLHTGRSRNDQVATGFRAVDQDAGIAIVEQIERFVNAHLSSTG